MASKQELKNKADSLKALLASLGRNRQEFKNIMDSTPVDSPAYLAAKAKFDATKPEFNDATTKYEAAQTTYDNFVQTQKDTQVASKAKNLLQQKKDEIKRAEDYNASAAYIEQLKNDLTTLQQQAQGKGSTVVEEEDPSVYVSDPNALAAYFGSAKVSQGSSGPTVQVTEPNATDPQGNPVTFGGILYTELSEDGADRGVRFLTSDDAVDKYKKQLLKLYGSKQGLVNKLYEARFLDSNKINSKTIDSQITAALNSAVQLYTVKQTDAVNTYGAKEVETLDEFLVPGANVGNTKTESRAVVFDDTNADNLTINVFKAIFGIEPTEKQKKQARPFIQEWQRGKPQVTTTTTSGEGNQQNVVVNTAGDAERMLIDELAQTDQAKASKVLDLYDVFKNTIGVQ
jgi:hypothetical protein